MTIKFITTEELAICEDHKKAVLAGLKSGTIDDARDLIRYLGLSDFDLELVEEATIEVYNYAGRRIYKIS